MECKTIRFWFTPDTVPNDAKCDAAKPVIIPLCPPANPPNSFELTRPLVITAPFIQCVVPDNKTGIRFQNNLTADIKISAMVVRKKNEQQTH